MGDGKSCVRYAEMVCDFPGPAMKLNFGPTTALSHDLDLQPSYAVANARSEGLCGGLLGGETRREAFGGVALAQAVGLFRRRKNPVEEPLPVAVYRLLDAPNFRQIDSRTNNHSVYQAT